MLNHLLAAVVGLGGLSLFLSGFFLPEVRRKPDFAWSGVALLYALVLWIEGDRTPGGALLGHIASVALILWFGWQALQQRRQFAPPEEQTAIPGSFETLTPFLKDGWGRIMVTYGETAAWVQDQLGKEDASTLLEIQPPPALQSDPNDEDWDDGEVASSPAPADTAEPSPTENVAEELIEATPSEVPIKTPPVAETLLDSVSDSERDQTQESSEVSPDPTPIQTEPEEIQSPVALEQHTTAALEPSVLTATEAPTAEETHHDHPQEEIVTESVSEPETEQDILTRKGVEESTHPAMLEDDDGTWPPQEIT